MTKDQRIILIDNNEIIPEDREISGQFTTYLESITEYLGIDNKGNDEINAIIQKLDNHPSV